MALFASNGIEIACEIGGPCDGEPLLLIHGVGAQLIRWPEGLLAEFAKAGFRIIRYDQRDIGLSTHMTNAPIPDITAVVAARMKGEQPDLPYSLDDLASDAFGLLDALDIESAHIFGVSLGGMVAQVMAIARPDRVRSLNLVMTQAGNPDMPSGDPSALAILSAPPPDPNRDLEAYLRHSVALNRTLGGTAYPIPEAELRASALASFQRAYHPAGATRQLAAGRGARDRREALSSLTLPALVIHGRDDPLIPLAGGEDVAAAIPDAWLLVLNGMGHDLPPELFPIIVQAVGGNAARALRP